MKLYALISKSVIYSLFVFVICTGCITAQSLEFNNSWWRSDQTYFHFTTQQSGLYRINYEDLREAGFPVDEIPARKWQLWSMGMEQRIYCTTDDIMTVDDYLIFYGVKNDGSLDRQLYSDADTEQLNSAFSIATDHRPYYLTWSDKEGHLRYQKMDPINAGATTEEYYVHHEKRVFSDYLVKPTHNGRDFIRYSTMDKGEGFGSRLQSEFETELPVSELSHFGVDPVITVRLATNVHSRDWQLYVNDVLIKSIVQSGYGATEISATVKRSILTNGSVNVRISQNSTDDAKLSVGWIDLAYPRRYSFDQHQQIEFYQQQSLLSRRVSFNNSLLTSPLIIDVDEGTIMDATTDGAAISFVRPATTDQRHLVISDANFAYSIDTLTPYKFELLTKDGDYLIISHDKFINGGSAQAYADYRQSEVGGNHRVDVVNIADLYHHYSYGVVDHPIAIKQFVSHLSLFGQVPKYAFLIGKGVEYATHRLEPKENSYYIPTYGTPGSDNMLLAPMGQNVPQMAIGRLAATTNEQVNNYLEKIKNHESPLPMLQTVEDRAWQKSILHLSGGSPDIQERLYEYLQNMGDIVRDATIGGQIRTFRKTSSDPIQTARSEEIIDAINKGSVILSFFGHSAIGTFDFSLEDPSKYDNQGKNPIIISLGCHSGNIHSHTRGISEDFVLEKDRGATHFIASSSTAYINPQYQMGKSIYRLIGENMYGQPIGTIINHALQELGTDDSLESITLGQQWTLHGDPAYQLPAFEGPDYTVDETSITTSPALINSTTKSFNVSFDIVNLGVKVDDILDLYIIHEYQNGQKRDTIKMSIATPAYSEHISINIVNPGLNAVGKNSIYIVLDPDNLIKEMPDDQAEKNNDFSRYSDKTYDFLILDNTAYPVSPRDFAIVNDPALTLRASLNNAFEHSGHFVMQIDTSERFDSPLLQQMELEAESSILEWSPTLAWKEGEVYYWRVSPIYDHHYLKNNSWKGHSFIYLPDSESGWNQSDYYQWLKDEFYQIQIDSISRRFSFTERLWDIRIKNKIKDENDYWVFVNNSPWASLNPKNLAPGIAIFAWHRDEVIISNSGSDYGSLPYSPDGFVYKTETPQQRRNIIRLLEALPEGSRVFLHTLIENEGTTLAIDEWDGDQQIYGTTLFAELEKYGSTKVTELRERGAVPFTMIFDKGRGLVIEDIAQYINETIDLSSIAASHGNIGSINSTIIGPASEWKSLIWSESREPSDQSEVLLYGIDQKGTKDLLLQVTDKKNIDINHISTEEYPFLQLEYQAEDEQRSSPHLNHWRVTGTDLSDAILYSAVDVPFTLLDTINAGEDLELQFVIKNDGEKDFEPMLVRYTLTDANNRQTTYVKRADAIPALGESLITESINTDQLGGMYYLSIEINPNYDQLELTNINNYGITKIYIKPDRKNPFLEVLLDGERAYNGQLTSNHPNILVNLYDPDATVLLDDPEDFDITIYYPQVLKRTISAEDIDVVFTPSTSSENNMAQFGINPHLSMYGTYRLVVSAKDQAGNKSGVEDYEVTFEVMDDGITNDLKVYPNPFYDQVTFNYLLEANRIPKRFYIRIYDHLGKEVNVIRRNDFNDFFYGQNIFTWKAVDHAGNSLPQGIYHYEVLNEDDSSIDKKHGSLIKISSP